MPASSAGPERRSHIPSGLRLPTGMILGGVKREVYCVSASGIPAAENESSPFYLGGQTVKEKKMNEAMCTISEKDVAINHQPRLMDRMLENKKRLEEKLKNINEAIAFLEKNPGYAEFTDILRKVGF